MATIWEVYGNHMGDGYHDISKHADNQVTITQGNNNPVTMP
jgi:hypothetical protein